MRSDHMVLETGYLCTPALGMAMMIRLGRLQGKEEDTELLLADLHLTQSCTQSCAQSCTQSRTQSCI